MRRVEFQPDEADFLTPDQQVFWDDWAARAQTAIDKSLEHWKDKGTKPKLNSKLWSEFKQWLLDEFFYDKCAYCEGPIGATSFGDAEHYRPKGQITVKSNGGEVTIKLANGDDHPGYFWLAYNWMNLIPACQRCNSTYKGTLFPLPDGIAHIFEPGMTVDDLDHLENPILLHPCRSRPEDHLEFREHGLVKEKAASEAGKVSIKTYGLDRERLNSSRAERQEDVIPALKSALHDSIGGKPLSESMQRFIGPKAPFSAAASAFVQRKMGPILKELSDFLRI